MEIKQIRPILTLNTPLSAVPRDWIVYIEQKVARAGFLPCWMWVGQKTQEGYPLVYTYTGINNPRLRRTKISARVFVANMFWSYPRDSMVISSCGNAACLNPSHMHIMKSKKKYTKQQYESLLAALKHKPSRKELHRDGIVSPSNLSKIISIDQAVA